jgi:hypothetical protein
MRIYLDLDTRRILTTAIRPATRLEFKRRDNDAFEVQFLRAGAVQELPAGATARVGLKATDDFAGEFLATDTLTQSGTGADTVYSGEFNLNTTAIEALFGDEPPSIPAMLEVEWTTGTLVGSSLTLPVLVYNDVIRGNEGAPATLPLFYTSETPDFLATQAQAEAGQNNTKWMSPLRTAQAIAALTEDGVSSWNDLTDKPETFPPASHTHPQSDITGLDNALLGKAAISHTHPQSDITGLETALLGKASAAHTHPLSDLTQSSATAGQVATWDGSAWVPQSPSSGVTSYNDLTDVPSTFPPATHTHAISEVTNLQTTLDGKAASSHTHAAADITSGTLAIARIPTGTTSSTVALGNHAHGNITNAGAIGTTAALPIITGTSGVLQAGSFGTTAGTFAEGNHTHSNYLTTSGGITEIAVVATMPATPVETTLYIVTG